MPSPVIESSPRKISVPSPAASRPGSSTRPEHRAAEAGGLQQQERADQRRAEQRADRREAARRGHHGGRGGRRVAGREPHRQDAEPAAHQDQRRLGTEHGAEGERGQRGEEDPGQLDRRQRSRGVEAVGRRVTAGPGQRADRQRREQPADGEQRQRPPGRRRRRTPASWAGRRTGRPAASRRARGTRRRRRTPAGRRARRAPAAARSCGSAGAPGGRAAASGGVAAGTAGDQFSSSRRSATMIRAAASIRARCEKACGKFPRWRLVSASNSSA